MPQSLHPLLSRIVSLPVHVWPWPCHVQLQLTIRNNGSATASILYISSLLFHFCVRSWHQESGNGIQELGIGNVQLACVSVNGPVSHQSVLVISCTEVELARWPHGHKCTTSLQHSFCAGCQGVPPCTAQRSCQWTGSYYVCTHIVL